MKQLLRVLGKQMKFNQLGILLLALPFLFGFTDIAHRGENQLGKYSEHSFAAYDHASADDANYLELDLQKTKDKVLVVSHDDNLSRVFGVDQEIGKSNFKTLQQARNYSGEPLHSLQEVFQRYQVDPEIKFMIETKDDVAGKGMERPLVRLVKKYHLGNRVLFESFSDSSLALLRKLAPNIPQMQLGGDYHQLGQYGYYANGFYDPQTARYLAAHDKGYIIWGVNRPQAMRRMMLTGKVSGIMTDYSNRMQHVVAQPNLLPVFFLFIASMV
ncbi:glycerophosphodiester phosphodiesterase family protein [Lactobacillus sp. HT06-2]|uniref:glycerophosphodiester phosphodiesterase n=1 Tax=Lactobacillus sp. HT06-2 TaxID=2080222 RepID=UPI000CD96E3C|nr:glycerophosphodiester phosphodiesterase family protein [Lactobacillus sp. HT06-2]